MNVACEFDSAESYEIFTYELHSMLVNETEERRKEILEAAITESTIKYVGKYWQCKVKVMKQYAWLVKSEERSLIRND